MKKENIYVNFFMETEVVQSEEKTIPQTKEPGEKIVKEKQVKTNDSTPEETQKENQKDSEKNKIAISLNILDLTKAFHKTREIARQVKELVIQNKAKFSDNYSVTIAELNEIIQKTNTLQRLITRENIKEMEIQIRTFTATLSSKVAILK